MKSLQYYPYFKVYNILGEYYDTCNRLCDINLLCNLMIKVCEKIRKDLIGKLVLYKGEIDKILRIEFDTRLNLCYLILEQNDYKHSIVRDFSEVYLID